MEFAIQTIDEISERWRSIIVYIHLMAKHRIENSRDLSKARCIIYGEM
jgi:hypothetical protein